MTRERVTGARFRLAGIVTALVGLACVGASPTDGPGHVRSTRQAAGPEDLDRPRFLFDDRTEDAGIDVTQARTWGSAWSDFAGDGRPSLLHVRHWGTAHLWRNGSDGFERFPADALSQSPFDRHQCAWGEADGDARPDLYCAQGARMGHGEGPDQLMIQGDGLADRAEELGVGDRLGRGRSVNWLDYDGDGDLDIFVGNAVRSGAPNRLFRNKRGSFSVVDAGVSESLDTVSSSWADWDSDGDPDLLVLQHNPLPAVAYENRKGNFVRTKIKGVTNAHWLSAAWGDYDGDGLTDLHVVSEERSAIVRNRGDHFKVVKRSRLHEGRMSGWLDVDNDTDLDLFVVQGTRGNRPTTTSKNRPDFLFVNRDGDFERVSDPSMRGPRDGNGDGVAIADFDRDGREDIFVTNGYFHFHGRSTLLRNMSRAGNWAALELQGGPWNPLAYGARLEVKVEGGPRYFRQTNDGIVFRTQSETGSVHLGLGKGTRAQVKVMWPGKGIDCLSVRAGTIRRLDKGSFPCS